MNIQIKSCEYCIAVFLVLLSLSGCGKKADKKEAKVSDSTSISLADTSVDSSSNVTQEDTVNFADGKIRLVLVIDDFGNQWDTEPVQGFLNLDIPVNIAVIPGHWAAKRTAEYAEEHGKEVLIHMPMEADHYDPNVEDKLIKVGMNRQQISDMLDKALLSVPGAIGLNNHQGSAATKNSELMSIVVDECKKRNLWILDSITHPKSVFYEEAVKAGIPAAQRDIFLDDVEKYDEIKKQLYHAVELAKRWKRPIVIIGHPHRETWKVINEELPFLAENGVIWLPISRILTQKTQLAVAEEL